jgi:hypothetical protein
VFNNVPIPVSSTVSEMAAPCVYMVLCLTEACAGPFAADALIAADAESIQTACDPDWNFDWKPVYDAGHDVAYAWAKATAHVHSKCYSSQSGNGKASGCAWGKASADAWIKATAKAVSEASAKAWGDSCECEEANAVDFGKAKTLEKLIADVYAYAEATVCVEGNDFAVADAYVSCFAHVYAHLYAKVRFQQIVLDWTYLFYLWLRSSKNRKRLDLLHAQAVVTCQQQHLVQALAKALLDGECYHYYNSEHAKAEILALAHSEVTEFDKCKIDYDTYGPGTTDQGGSSDTTVVRCHLVATFT